MGCQIHLLDQHILYFSKLTRRKLILILFKSILNSRYLNLTTIFSPILHNYKVTYLAICFSQRKVLSKNISHIFLYNLEPIKSFHCFHINYCHGPRSQQNKHKSNILIQQELDNVNLKIKVT